MDKTTMSSGSKDQINNLRSFFREYLKYVSRLQPKLGVYSALIESLFQQIEETEGFKEAFAKRGKTDYRKWAEFLNLIRGFARLNGRDFIKMDDVNIAADLFQESLSTLAENFSKASLQQGINYDHVELHKKLIKKFGSEVGGATLTMKEARKFANSMGMSKQWTELMKLKRPDGTKLIEEMGTDVFIKPNWDGEAQ